MSRMPDRTQRHGMPPGSRRGAVLVLSGLLLIMIFGFVAFSIDVGYINLVKTQLQSTADAAALAAAQELTDGSGTADDAAFDVARKNQAAGGSVTLDRKKDVELGEWDFDTREFKKLNGKKADDANAVRVFARLNDKRGSGVNLFFAPILGHSRVDMQTSAIAVVGHREPRDIVLVIDCSGSMGRNNRIQFTRAAALALCDEIVSTDRLGLAVYSYPIQVLVSDTSRMPVFPQFGKVLLADARTSHFQVLFDAGLLSSSFGYFKKHKNKKSNKNNKNKKDDDDEPEYETVYTGYLERAMSFDHDLVKDRIPELKDAMYASGTNIAGGMRVAIEEFQNNPRADQSIPPEKIMVLMTDGHANITEAPGNSPVNSMQYYADLAKAEDIVIHGITLGSSAAKGAVKQVTSTTGGEYHHVEDGDFEGLFDVYRRIGRGDAKPKLVR